MKILVAIGLGVACAVAVACGGAKSAKVTGSNPLVTPVSTGGRGEIEQLDREIGEKLSDMGIARPAAAMIDPTNPPTAMGAKNLTSAQDPECQRGQSDTCNRSCTLADSICTNASRICKIADDMGDDAWAKEKCASSTESCRVAHESCCSCS